MNDRARDGRFEIRFTSDELKLILSDLLADDAITEQLRNAVAADDGFVSAEGTLNDLDDLLRRGDTRFAHEVVEILLQRVDQRLELAEELLQTKHDFTVDEEIVTDRDETRYPRSEAEAREKWRKPLNRRGSAR